ncbi:MAG: DUF6263 family protein [Paludibacter sp.]|nr:DUF6263 family protein [Paludibacter sp.]
MKKLILSAFVALSGIALMAQTPVNIKLNLEKGKVYTIKSTSKQAIQQSVSGQQYNLDVTSNSVISYKVLSKINDIMEIEFKFDTIATKISSTMFNKETNSAKPAGNEPIDKIMNKMSTYKLIAKISTAGKFIEFVNYSKYKDSIMFVMDSIPASKKDMAQKQADALLSESAVKSMVEPLFAYLPDKAVKTGDTWETTYVRAANNMSMLCLNSFTLKGIENNVATISGKSDIESMPSNDPNAQMSSELKGTITFDGTLDLKTGLALKNSSKGHIEGTSTMKNNGNEMKIPLVIDSQSETEMLK